MGIHIAWMCMTFKKFLKVENLKKFVRSIKHYLLREVFP